MSENQASVDSMPSILLVDDDAFMLDVQSSLLTRMGYRDIETVRMAEVALESLLAGRHKPDIIVCDLNMPGMDGVEFLQRLNASAFVGSVILLSGEGARLMHTVQKLLGGGRLTVLGALQKPARPDTLRPLLERWAPLATPPPSRAVAQTVTVEAVREAVRQRQWVLHYQPKVNLATGGLEGVEALVRWNHPQFGLVHPDRFIPVAEACGAIDALTDWVLAESASQLARWTAAGTRLHVAVNLSMDNLAAPDFAQRAGQIVRDAGVSPTDITLEITESRAMAPSATPLACLVRLRLLRFKLSIDDFGTGHSSLAQLRDVPFTELKIDRGFVTGARTNQIIQPMLEGSIGLAKRLNMVSVAEGIETADDLAFLREIECEVGQGYHIGRPMDVDALRRWMLDWRDRRRDVFDA